MADRAKQFIEQFDAAVKIMLENAPVDLSVCVSIYARDCANRTTEQPDGTSYMTSATRGGYFDRATFKEYVNAFYSSK